MFDGLTAIVDATWKAPKFTQAAGTGDTAQSGSFYLKKTFMLYWIAVYSGFDRMASKKFSACPPIESSFLTSLRFQVFTEIVRILVSGDVQES